MEQSERREKQEQQKQKERIKLAYDEKVKEYTPTHNLAREMIKAFITGGLICMLGQAIITVSINYGLSKDDAATVCTIVLILFSVLLTGLNIYPGLAKFGGAGALVPITGFANSVAAPAIEFQKEGQVFGIGCKIFTISGPVILYGIFTSWMLGVIYWIGKILGVV